MKWLQSALGQRVIGLLLLLLLLAAIVFGGQALHIPRETAYLVALAALFVAVVVFFVAQYRASRRSRTCASSSTNRWPCCASRVSAAARSTSCRGSC